MFRFITRLSFISGIFLGVFVAILVKINNKVEQHVVTRPFQYSRYQKWFENTKLTRQKVPIDSLRYKKESCFLESQYLYDKIPVLCVVLTKSERNAEGVQNTWGKHCNNLQFVYLKAEKKKIPSIKRNKEDSSWVILCKVLKQVPDDVKWLLVVYDYTFVIVENLRLFVAALDYKDQFYLGHVVQFWNSVYNMGQAGYVLSKGTIDKFKERFPDDMACSKMLTYKNQEDFYLGKSLANMNITPQDTRDDYGLSTFHPYNLYHIFYPKEEYYKSSIYPHKCCSPHTITFQGIEGDKMYTYYYLIYTVQLFHFGHLGNKLTPKNYTDDKVWKKFLQERGLPENITAQQYYKVWENIVDDPTSFAKHMKREQSFDYV